MKTRQRKVFERVVNPLLVKHLVSRLNGYHGSCIASGIPIKYLSYFKEVSAQKNAKKLSICHMNREKSLGKESIIVIKFSKKGAQML